MSTTLHDYADVEPIAVREIRPVHAPRGGEILGFIGPSNRDANCIVAQEYRWPKEDGSQNYYRKLGGYSFDVSALEHLKAKNVTRLVIQEMDNNRVLEFDLTQFLNGDDGGTVDGIQQLGVPNDDALHAWTNDEAEIMSASERQTSDTTLQMANR